MPTYPFQIPTGTSIIPFGSGNQDLGSTSKYFGTVYANSIIQTGASAAGSITGPAVSTFSGVAIWGNTNGTVLADSPWAIYTGTSDLNGSLVPTGNASVAGSAIVQVGSNALPVGIIFTTASGISNQLQVNQAWCSWDQANGTPTISGSYNVTSLTDNAVGDTSVNFTSPMPSNKYATIGSTTDAGGTVNMMAVFAMTTSSVRLATDNQNVGRDNKINSIYVFDRPL